MTRTDIPDWSSKQYLRFNDERTRAARDLLAQVPPGEVQRAVDLGCGPGNSTELLVERYPEAIVSGVDTSPDMLDAAAKLLPDCRFHHADVGAWRADEPQDLLFANAVLQWLPDHAILLPGLMAQLAPGGVLAVQMPDNLDEPSHAAMRKVAAGPRFAARLGAAAGERTELATVDGYYRILKPHAAKVDLWRTTYNHPLEGPDAIVEWLKGTGLRPFLAPLGAAEREDYLAAYRDLITAAYPRNVDGRALLAFPRLFMIAVR